MGLQTNVSRSKASQFGAILLAERRVRKILGFQVGLVALAIVISFWVTGMFDGDRISEGLPAIGVLISDMMPPTLHVGSNGYCPCLRP